MGGFKVQIAALRSMASQLGAAGGDIKAAHRQLSSANTGDLGSGKLDGAADEFVDRWGNTLAKLAAATDGMRNQLNRAAALYQQSDSNSVGYFKGVPEPSLIPKGAAQ